MIKSILLLILATIIWGMGFVATRYTLNLFDAWWATAVRFIVAGIATLPYLIIHRAKLKNKIILKESMIASLFLFGVLLFQAMGLQLTSVMKSGFITTLYAVILPIIGMIYYKKKYKKLFWILTLLSLLGVFLMCDSSFSNLNKGDFLTFLCAICGALHINYVGIVAKRNHSPILFNFLQTLFVAMFSLVAALIFSPKHFSLRWDQQAWLGIFYLAIISSLISFTIQVIAQKKIPTHIAGLVFLMESPWAAFFGFLILHEPLSTMSLIGAAIILSSIALIPFLGREII